MKPETGAKGYKMAAKNVFGVRGSINRTAGGGNGGAGGGRRDRSIPIPGYGPNSDGQHRQCDYNRRPIKCSTYSL